MAIISFDISVTDLEAVLALYDRIQVWRAATVDGSYDEITDSSDEPAILYGSQVGPWALNGLSLSISQGGGPAVQITFVGTNPLPLSVVLAQINAAGSAVASEVDDDGTVKLESVQSGTGASLLVGGAAAAVLGLSTVKTNGKTHRIILTSPTTLYRFRDFDGLVSDFYKTRFFSSVTGAASEFSAARQGAAQVLLPESNTSIAKINLVDGSGRPVVGRRVIFVPVTATTISYNATNYAVLPGVDRLYTVTNDRGYAEMALVRGSRFKVFVEGVQFQREVTVPNADEFDLLAAMASAPDPFTIVQIPPMPIRNS